jgi:hypothetical protein
MATTTPQLTAKTVIETTLNQHAAETCQGKLEAALHTALAHANITGAHALAREAAAQRIPTRGTGCCLNCKAEHAAAHGNVLHTHSHTH